MKICIAQTKSIAGNIQENINKHLTLVRLAISHNADAIFFPELSLTGYEPSLAKELATNQEDARFNVFQQISDDSDITIGIGVPTNSTLGVHISMVIFQPNTPKQTYSKQQLHADELPYFTKGSEQVILTVNSKKLAPAICYESLQSDHCQNAVNLGAEMYIASVAKPKNSLKRAFEDFSDLAQQYSIPVLMCNAIGFCDNFESGGTSSVWNKKGELLAQLDEEHEGLLIYDTESETVMKDFLD